MRTHFEIVHQLKGKWFHAFTLATTWFDLIRFQFQAFLARKVFLKWSELTSIFNKLQVNGDIRWCFPLLPTLKSWLVQDCSSENFQVNLPDIAQWTAAKNCRKLVFCVFPEQLLSHRLFWRLHCYEVTLVKKYIQLLLQKRFSNKKDFIKSFFKPMRKILGVLRLNHIMCTLLTISKVSQNYQSWYSFLVSCKLMKTYAEVFLCYKL